MRDETSAPPGIPGIPVTVSVPDDSPAAHPLEQRISLAGNELQASLTRLMEAVPSLPQGPQAFARTLGIDKVLASRFLKAVRSPDPMSAIHRIPGPEPLRRVVRALGRQGGDGDLVRRAQHAIDGYETLIRTELGDRSELEAVLSAWAPEARREFEMRRKQAAFRAMSQLKGVEMNTLMATVLLHPAADGEHIDIIWINGAIGLRRLRPGVGVKFATRRMSREPEARRPRTLDGDEIESAESIRLDEFCSKPLASLRTDRIGEVVHYTLADETFGPRSAADLVFCEVNLSEIRRFVSPESRRKRYVFAEVSTPARLLHFDAIVHEDLFTTDPALRIYDAAIEGVADVNDPARDIDRLDLLETIEPLGLGLSRFRSADVPRYADLLRTVCNRMNWDGARFRGHRCRIEYPVYGSQVVMAFEAPVARSQ